MFKCLLPKIKKDTRKYLNVYFYTPIRPEPDLLRGTFSNTQPWKTLPVGHWWQSLQFTNSKNVNLSRRQFPCGSPIIQSHKLPRTQTPCNTNIIIHCSMYFCNCRTAIAVTPFPDKLAFIWKELPGWGGLSFMHVTHITLLSPIFFHPVSFFHHKRYEEHRGLMSVGHKRKVWKWWSVVWESLSEEPTGQLLKNYGSISWREKKIKQEIVNHIGMIKLQ